MKHLIGKTVIVLHLIRDEDSDIAHLTQGIVKSIHDHMICLEDSFDINEDTPILLTDAILNGQKPRTFWFNTRSKCFCGIIETTFSQI